MPIQDSDDEPVFPENLNDRIGGYEYGAFRVQGRGL
jgi:hypothetical protein